MWRKLEFGPMLPPHIHYIEAQLPRIRSGVGCFFEKNLSSRRAKVKNLSPASCRLWKELVTEPAFEELPGLRMKDLFMI